jgi:hypothetical protein
VNLRIVSPVKLISWILLVVLLALMVNGVHAHDHPVAIGGCGESAFAEHGDAAPAHNCPCTPEQHQESDGCDSCAHCTCHAPLTVQTFRLTYAPLVLALQVNDPFAHMPEVYLPKFIPPQLQA